MYIVKWYDDEDDDGVSYFRNLCTMKLNVQSVFIAEINRMINTMNVYIAIDIIHHHFSTWLTRCLSTCKTRKLGSKSNFCGSKLTGDCRRPLLHRDHSGLIKPQKAGPKHQKGKKKHTVQMEQRTLLIVSGQIIQFNLIVFNYFQQKFSLLKNNVFFSTKDILLIPVRNNIISGSDKSIAFFVEKYSNIL